MMEPTQQSAARAPENSSTEPHPGPSAPDRGGLSRLRPRRAWLWFPLILLVNYLVVWMLTTPATAPTTVSYTFFKQQVEAANVVEVTSSGDKIDGSFKKAVSYQPESGAADESVTDFETVVPAFADPGLEQLLEANGVAINSKSTQEATPWWMTLLFTFGPTLLLIGGFLWLTSNATSGASAAGGGLFGIGRSRARRYAPGEDTVTFADVAGIEDAKQELVEVVDFLREPGRYTRLGGAMPKGVLLVGPPGTGKTLLARAVAGEAGVPFFSMGASEFVEMIVGVGASRVRDLFKQAREAAPAIIFIDELDAIGRARGGLAAFGGQSEQEQTLNQILSEMDGFSSREGVIVLAATNRPDVLDPALLRPGRFDRRVVVQPPDRIGREAILKVHVRKVPLGPDVDLTKLAGSTPGLVGADLRNLVNEAALLAARRDEPNVRAADFTDALEKVLLGPARHLYMPPSQRERVAYHESGHTICGLLQPSADPVHRVSITPRGLALGVTYQRPEEDRQTYSEPQLRARIVTALGGRAAEELVYAERSTGAEDDVQQATSLARQMVTRWAMSDRLGPVSLAPRESPFLNVPSAYPEAARPFSEGTAELVDGEVRRIEDESYTQALDLLRQHRPQLDALARALLEKETLDEAEIREVTGLQPAQLPRLLPVPLSAVAFRAR